LIHRAKFDLKDSRTLADFFYLIYPSRVIARLVTALTLGSYIMLLFVELYMGTVLLTVFLGDAIFYKTIGFFAVGCLVLMYVRLGGYKAIVRTDRYQLVLMVAALLSVFIYGIACPVLSDYSASEILVATTQYNENPLIFMLWLGTINILYPFSQLSNYQRVTATQCANTSLKGVISGSYKLLLLFLLTIGGFLLLGAKGHQVNTITDFLLLVKNSEGILQYLFIPLILGFASMVYSSADIAVIATFYSLSDLNTFKNKFSKMNEDQLRRVLTLCTLGLLLVLTVIYFLQFSGLEAWLMPLIYTVVGQLAILVPVPLFLLIQNMREQKLKIITMSKGNTQILFMSILFSWVMLFVSAYLSKVTGEQYWSLLSMPAGMAVVFCAVMSLKKKNKEFAHVNGVTKVNI
jgi:Na+/proline symporter